MDTSFSSLLAQHLLTTLLKYCITRNRSITTKESLGSTHSKSAAPSGQGVKRRRGVERCREKRHYSAKDGRYGQTKK